MTTLKRKPQKHVRIELKTSDYKKLKKLADDNYRSIAAHVKALVEEYLFGQK